MRARSLAAYAVGAILAVVALSACTAREPVAVSPEPRQVLVEGEVLRLVGRRGLRVGDAASGADGVLVVMRRDRDIRRSDRIRVVGMQRTLRLPELPRDLDLDLDDLRRYEGEEVVLAEAVTRLAPRRSSDDP